MHDVGLVVEQAAEPVADKISHNAGAFAFGITLDSGTDVTGGATGLCRLNAQPQAFIGDFDEPLGLA